MKRSIALMLAWIMVLSMAVPVFAAEEGADLSGALPAAEDMSDSVQQDETQGAEQSAPVEVPAPAEENEPSTAAENETTPVPEGFATPTPESVPAPEGVEATPAPEDEATPAPESEAMSVPESEAMSVPEDETTPALEGETTPIPEIEATPAPENEIMPVPEGEATPEPEQSAVPSPEMEPTPEPEDAQPQFALISDLPAAVGQVDVRIAKALDLGGWTPDFMAVLDGPEHSASLTVTANGTCCSFFDVPAGDYTLTVTGAGFAVYTQSLHVGMSDGVTLQLTAGKLAGYETGAHPGLLQLGDVDGNGAVDSADAAVMMQAIDQMLPAEGGRSALGFTDLNGDGVTNLADAEYLAKGLDIGYLDGNARSATEEHYVPEKAVAVAVAPDTQTSGKDSLFRDDGTAFTMGRTNGAPISAAEPVAVSFDMADGAQADVILLDDTNILSGLIEIAYADGTVADGVIGPAPQIMEPAQVTEAPEPAANEQPAVIGDVPPEVTNVPVVTDAPAVTEEPVVMDVPETVDVPEITDVPVVTEEPVVTAEPVPPEADLPGEILDASETDLYFETVEAPEVPLAGQPEDGIAVIAAAPESIGHVTETVSVTQDASGNIRVDLGGKKAVKRVTLKITGTADYGSLASISQVEFVNGMENRIPEPSLDIPQSVGAAGASRQFTVTWAPCVNITGYEVEVSANGVTEVIPLAGTSLTVTRFNNDEVLNYTVYQVRVRSVNGTWTSGWSDAVSVTPRPTSAPDKPDNVKAEGGYQSVTVSWKNMKDTTAYDLFYKEVSQESFAQIADLTVTSYVISGLDSTVPTTYEVYVVGRNEFGSSPESMHASATTITLDPADMPRFNLINRDGAGVPCSAHIVSAVQNHGIMVGSPMDAEAGTAWGTVDGSGASYYDRKTWDDGGYNNLSATIGLIYTFDQPYLMDTIGMLSVEPGMDYTYVKLRWWDAAGTEHYIDRTAMRSERRTDSLGRTYFFLRLPEPVEAVKVQIGVARYWAGNNRISVSEVYFYKYDPLKRELADLYADDLHTMLKDTVTEEQLNDLKSRIGSSADEFGQVNPDKDQLLREWETAWKIYHDQFLGKVTQIHTGITASGDEHGFGGLNAWQPLGVTAAAGETVTVYVGNSAMKSGSSTSLQLVITQYHAEASAMSKVLTTLKVGANEVHIPKIWTTTGVESGGALYVQYTGGANASDSYAVRVSGGTAVPVLDLYRVTDPGERAARTSAYLAELQSYAANIQALHGQVHQGEGSVSREVDYDYDEQNCILGATDILLDTMMLSLPAQQVVSGCSGSAATLLGSLDAMEDMMGLFYQHKGLNASAPNAADRIPNRHLNIRYQRMFSGAFMYASGDHIGIGWNETDDMAGCSGVQADANGLYLGGNYFGWGIAHEIGHDINQGSYAIAEITNNYFAVLAQARDTNDSVRFDYENVYDKVTSGTKGSSANVFTQLGMYWQLHLAYDRGYNFKTYAGYDEQLASLFFARVDTYARTPDRAPKPGGVALSLQGADVDQILMRLACAAAERDILDFFRRWGKTPDETTVAYASQFPAEMRAIYYVCDDSRRYTMEHGGSSKLSADGSTAAVSTVTAAADPNQANKVNISIATNGTVDSAEILGYEIVRCTIAGGKLERRTVGFATEGAFSDVVYAMNNRTVYYEITLVDKYLNRSAPVSTDMVKIQHEGDLDKAHWTVVTTGLTVDPADVTVTAGNEDMPEAVEEDVALRMTDGKVETVYSAVVGEGAGIELDFQDTQVITGFRYKAGGGTPIAGYVIEVRQSGEWLRADAGELGGSRTVYFSNADGKYVSTYAADALRLTLTGQAGAKVSVAELDVLGLTGDDVDFRRADGSDAAIGYLSSAFRYGDGENDVIPARSLVFTGSYKGNAAYNVVMLYDQDGNVVSGIASDGSKVAYQTILADAPDTGSIQDVTDGVWLYWIQPEDQTLGFQLPRKVRVELYRVNNAQTNEGERLVSDSLFVDIPASPGDITLSGIG